ncbi:DUF262 domain-containing protein [Streptomyces pseudogriseolus]|uniref:DUF262 domain-containing protein n=1 Tax=Streptomyces pseudogriseolus TaxID=36817 RepID=UPI003FA303AF
MSDHEVSSDSSAGADADGSNAVVDESTVDDSTLREVPEASLDYFGADFDVAGLVRRLQDGDIVIPRFDPDEAEDLETEIDPFQRAKVWSPSRMETFIESLLLGWPVPSIFLVVESDERYLVLDGQQRLTSLRHFYEGTYPNGHEFVLHNVVRHLQGKSYSNLSRPEKRKLDNTFIQATVVQPKGSGGANAVYSLFGRLNSGGVVLTPQEVRVALYMGEATDWIREMNRDAGWRSLFGKKSPRLKDHELILRALALREVLSQMKGDWPTGPDAGSYSPPMAGFLNTFLNRHRHLKNIDKKALGGAFSEACRLLAEAEPSSALRYQKTLNAAHVDAVLASLMELCLEGRAPTAEQIKLGLQELRGNETYKDYVTRSTSHVESVRERLKLAYSAMGGSKGE